MADWGFAIEGDLPSGESLNILPFLQEFSEHDQASTRNIAKHRIHVERVGSKNKNSFLQHKLPISMAAELNKMWIIFSYLTLFNRPIIALH